MSSTTATLSSGTDGIQIPLITGNQNFNSVTSTISSVVERKTPLWWWPAFGVAASILLMMLGVFGYLFWEGLGIWGLNNNVDWAWDITNFVWWVGIGHAGTLISAVLFLFRQKWRTSINRFAEAMTIFAVMCAAMFPAIHVGRIWVIYWVFPLPNQMQMWPNFRSPLLWDVFAISTYFTVSLLFWYVGLIPDLATLRDRATSKTRRIVYGLFALGWRGGNRQWKNYEKAYMILAGLSTPLVLSVHTVVSFDFATSVIPGWHTTILPPYFVAGAIFSGFAMVMTLAIPVRTLFSLENFITMKHLENMNKIMLCTGMMVGYAYGCEFFIAWYSANPYELSTFINRATGPYWWAYWSMLSCNVLAPQIFWSKKLRTNIPAMFIASIVINIGMWFERFVIIVTSMAQTQLPSAWGYFSPTIFDVLTYVGTFGLFSTFFLLFLRFLPSIAISEVKNVLPMADPHYYNGHGTTHNQASTAKAGVTNG
jgi:Ni/Fe-hydrogenase subunit HybB-like protein